MARDWIKMRCDLRTHPKVVQISSALKSDRLRTLGGLLAVWSLFDAHSVDGILPGYTFQIIDEEIGWKGFCRALSAPTIGWIEQTQDGVKMPRFEAHNGDSAKRRAEDADRKRSEREADKSRTDRGPEKRREEKNLKQPPEQAAALVETASGPDDDPRCASLRSVCSANRISLNARGAMHIAQWAHEGVSVLHIEQAIALARERKPDPEVIPAAYLAPIVADLRAGRIAPPAQSPEDVARDALALIRAREARELAASESPTGAPA